MHFYNTEYNYTTIRQRSARITAKRCQRCHASKIRIWQPRERRLEVPLLVSSLAANSRSNSKLKIDQINPSSWSFHQEYPGNLVIPVSGVRYPVDLGELLKKQPGTTSTCNIEQLFRHPSSNNAIPVINTFSFLSGY